MAPAPGRLLAGLLPAAGGRVRGDEHLGAGGGARRRARPGAPGPGSDPGGGQGLGPGGGRLPAWRRLASGAAALAVLGACSLPWLVPSLLRTVYADPAGVDGVRGACGYPLRLARQPADARGGWNAQTVPAGYGGGWSVLWLAFVIAAAVSFLAFGLRSDRWPGLGVAAVTGLALPSSG